MLPSWICRSYAKHFVCGKCTWTSLSSPQNLYSTEQSGGLFGYTHRMKSCYCPWKLETLLRAAEGVIHTVEMLFET